MTVEELAESEKLPQRFKGLKNPKIAISDWCKKHNVPKRKVGRRHVYIIEHHHVSLMEKETKSQLGDTHLRMRKILPTSNRPFIRYF